MKPEFHRSPLSEATSQRLSLFVKEEKPNGNAKKKEVILSGREAIKGRMTPRPRTEPEQTPVRGKSYCGEERCPHPQPPLPCSLASEEGEGEPMQMP